MNLLAQTGLFCRHFNHSRIILTQNHLQQHRYLSTSQLKKYLDILEINKDSTPKQIKDSFLKLSKVYHPDNKTTGSHAKFVELKEAYDAMKEGSPTPTSQSSTQPGSYRYYDDFDAATHAKYREHYQRQYQNNYERNQSHFGGPYANSSTPWEDLMRDRRYRRQKTYRESFTTRSGKPLIHLTIFLSAIAWIFIYSAAILVWDYNDQVRRGLHRHNSRSYEDYVAYEDYLRKKESARLLNFDRFTGVTRESERKVEVPAQPEIVDVIDDNHIKSAALPP